MERKYPRMMTFQRVDSVKATRDGMYEIQDHEEAEE